MVQLEKFTGDPSTEPVPQRARTTAGRSAANALSDYVFRNIPALTAAGCVSVPRCLLCERRGDVRRVSAARAAAEAATDAVMRSIADDLEETTLRGCPLAASVRITCGAAPTSSCSARAPMPNFEKAGEMCSSAAPWCFSRRGAAST